MASDGETSANQIITPASTTTFTSASAIYKALVSTIAFVGRRCSHATTRGLSCIISLINQFVHRRAVLPFLKYSQGPACSHNGRKLWNIPGEIRTDCATSRVPTSERGAQPNGHSWQRYAHQLNQVAFRCFAPYYDSAPWLSAWLDYWP